MKFRTSHILLIFIFLLQNSLGTVMAAQMQFHQLLLSMSEVRNAATSIQGKKPCPHHAQQSAVKVDMKAAALSGIHCGSLDCSQCQCTTNLNLIVASKIRLFTVFSFHNQRDNLASALIKMPPCLILRPPKS